MTRLFCHSYSLRALLLLIVAMSCLLAWFAPFTVDLPPSTQQQISVHYKARRTWPRGTCFVGPVRFIYDNGQISVQADAHGQPVEEHMIADWCIAKGAKYWTRDGKQISRRDWIILMGLAPESYVKRVESALKATRSDQTTTYQGIQL